MTSVNANNTDYERFEILGQDALFTCLRIDRNTLPNGLYAYDLRGDDYGGGNICELRDFISVNHLGTAIVKEPIDGSSEGIAINEDDYNFLGDEMTLDEFVQDSPEFQQTMN